MQKSRILKMNILKTPLNLGMLTKAVDKFPYRTNFSSLITKLSCLGKKGNREPSNDLEKYQELVKREPCNPNAHLKLARIYEKKGARQQASAEYFLAAEVFFRNGLYPDALAIYKRILEQDPSLDQIRLKIANTYQKIELLEKAFSQYSQLLHHYQGLGMKDKAQEIMTLLDGFNQENFKPDEKAYLKYRLVKEVSKFQENGNSGSSRKEEEFFDLRGELDDSMPMDIDGGKETSTEKIYGFEAILKELKESAPSDKVYPNFHYHMGTACSEMGFGNEAIEQFQMAIEKGQSPFEAAQFLDSILAERDHGRELPDPSLDAKTIDLQHSRPAASSDNKFGRRRSGKAKASLRNRSARRRFWVQASS
jgi:tetratricopeptide (TPR) repeat protein